MKYLVKGRLRTSKKDKLLDAIKNNRLGAGSVAFGEYVKNMHQARLLDDGYVCWIEVCFCPTPLKEEISYWQEYFEDIVIKNAVSHSNCKDSNGTSKRACFDCSCDEKLEQRLLTWGKQFLTTIQPS
jgi:hypothetical protein